MGDEKPFAQPFTPRAKKVLELAPHEADELRVESVSPYHLLLGILRVGDGIAVGILRDFGVEPERVRGRVLSEIDGPPEETRLDVRSALVRGCKTSRWPLPSSSRSDTDAATGRAASSCYGAVRVAVTLPRGELERLSAGHRHQDHGRTLCRRRSRLHCRGVRGGSARQRPRTRFRAFSACLGARDGAPALAA